MPRSGDVVGMPLALHRPEKQFAFLDVLTRESAPESQPCHDGGGGRAEPYPDPESGFQS